jgi:hypothetical protein
MVHIPPRVTRAAIWLSVTLLCACGSGDYLHKLVGPRRVSFGRLDLPCNEDSDCTSPARCRLWETPTGQRSRACLISCKPEQVGRGDCPWPLTCVASVVAGAQVGPVCEAPVPDEWRCWRPDGSNFACELRDSPVQSRAATPRGREQVVELMLFLGLVLLPLAACNWLARRAGRSLPPLTSSGIRTASMVLAFLCWAAIFGGAEMMLAAWFFGLRPLVLPVLSWSAAVLFGWLRMLIRPAALGPSPPP